MLARVLAVACGVMLFAAPAVPAGAAAGARVRARSRLTAGRRPEVSPFVMKLLPGPSAPSASGQARLVYAESPFGVALTADGREVYDLKVTAADLPDPATLGAYHAYVAWAATPDLSRWQRLGEVRNGTSTVGSVQWNKWLLVVAASASSSDTTHAGPVVLHGTSPSGWLQKFITHPLFRGIPF